MLGLVSYEDGGWGRPERAEMYGLPVARVRVEPGGRLAEWRLRRAGRALGRQGVTRTLVPGGFSRWDVLKAAGLIPVDPGPFLRSQSDRLVLGLLERRGTAPDRATVALRGMRADRDMIQAAVRLCPVVRNLVISAPRGGGELARWLRREFGIPILPPQERGQAAVFFQAVEETAEESGLTLFGSEPELRGLSLELPQLADGDRSNIFLLSALWEGGILEEKELKIT